MKESDPKIVPVDPRLKLDKALLLRGKGAAKLRERLMPVQFEVCPSVYYLSFFLRFC